MTTDDAFDEFLIRLEPDIPSTSLRYLRARQKLIRFFEWRSCRDAEGLTDETVERLLKDLSAGKEISRPWSYVYGIATNVHREYLRRMGRFVGLKNDFESVVDEADDFVECATICLERLPDDKRRLVEQYYSDEGSRIELAKRMGLSLARLRLKIHRIKNELKECYHKCIQGQIS